MREKFNYVKNETEKVSIEQLGYKNVFKRL